MRVTDTKIKRILEKDYSEARIKEGQEWYIGHGVFLDPYETKNLLLDLMENYRPAVKSARLLRDVIDEELGRYMITDNLFGSVLDLGERLSIIECYAEEYIRLSRYMNEPVDKLRADCFSDYEPFEDTSADKTDDYELPF